MTQGPGLPTGASPATSTRETVAAVGRRFRRAPGGAFARALLRATVWAAAMMTAGLDGAGAAQGGEAARGVAAAQDSPPQGDDAGLAGRSRSAAPARPKSAHGQTRAVRAAEPPDWAKTRIVAGTQAARGQEGALAGAAVARRRGSFAQPSATDSAADSQADAQADFYAEPQANSNAAPARFAREDGAAQVVEDGDEAAAQPGGALRAPERARVGATRDPARGLWGRRAGRSTAPTPLDLFRGASRDPWSAARPTRARAGSGAPASLLAASARRAPAPKSSPASSAPTRGAESPPGPCEAQVAAAARRHGVPEAVLFGIGLTETGRRGRLSPYALNIDGRTVFPADLAGALATFEQARAQGAKFIDVGCMQINHRFHGKAFGSAAAMFDPARNVDYSARFLKQLHARQGSWTLAAARYNAGPDNDPAQRRYVCAVMGQLVASGAGRWTESARAFCGR